MSFQGRVGNVGRQGCRAQEYMNNSRAARSVARYSLYTKPTPEDGGKSGYQAHRHMIINAAYATYIVLLRLARLAGRTSPDPKRDLRTAFCRFCVPLRQAGKGV